MKGKPSTINNEHDTLAAHRGFLLVCAHINEEFHCGG
jgi:hypothetical protein